MTKQTKVSKDHTYQSTYSFSELAQYLKEKSHLPSKRKQLKERNKKMNKKSLIILPIMLSSLIILDAKAAGAEEGESRRNRLMAGYERYHERRRAAPSGLERLDDDNCYSIRPRKVRETSTASKQGRPQEIDRKLADVIEVIQRLGPDLGDGTIRMADRVELHRALIQFMHNEDRPNPDLE